MFFINNYFKDILVIINLFNYKNLQNGVILHCHDDTNSLLINKMFHTHNIRFHSKRVGENESMKLEHHEKVGIIVDSSCEGWNNVFDNLNYNESFKNPFIWFVITENLTTTTNILSLYKIELDSDVTIIAKRDKVFDLYEIYYTGFNRRGQVIVRQIGIWDKSLFVKIDNRRDLKGLVLRSTVVILNNQKFNKTFERYLDSEEPDLVKTDSLHRTKFFTALKFFQDMFNITFELQRTNSWGYPTNGSFDGMVGALQRRESDISGSPMFIRSDRAMAIDYVAEAWPTITCFIFRHPKHPGGFFSIYTRPLTPSVWYCIIAVMTVFTAVLGLLLKMKTIREPGDDKDVSPSLALLFIWSALCQQGMSIRRNSVSVKMVIFVTFIFALTIYQYYNATVVSTLLREPPKNIKTSEDLFHSNLKIGIEDILYNKDNFKRTTDPIALKIYHEKVTRTVPHNFYSAEHGITLVKKGKFALYIDRAVAYRIMRRTFSEQEVCELQEVMLFAPLHTGVAVAKRSSYREIVAYGIQKMKESGLLTRILTTWDQPRLACVKTPDTSVFSVSIQEFSTALLVLTVGYAASLMVLAGEIIVRRMQRRKVIEFRH